MRSAAPDLSSLARIAQHPGEELRPLLLLVHAQLFAAAGAGREPSACEAFAAIALGLLPLVPDDVVAEVAAILRRCPETPAAVQAALRARGASYDLHLEPEALGVENAFSPICLQPTLNSSCEDPVAPAEPGAVPSRAKEPGMVLDGRAISALVERALTRPGLAAALLRRPDLGLHDRAALFRFADAELRDRIRRELRATALPPAPQPPATEWEREEVLALAFLRDLPGLFGRLRQFLNLPADWTCDLGEAGDREIFVLALLSLGLSSAECIRVVLVLGHPTSRSVEAVFRLAQVARSTTREVALHLTGAEPARRPASARPPEAVGPRHLHPARRVSFGLRPLRPDGRSDLLTDAAAYRPGEGRAPIGRADHRSRSTTGPGRS